MTTDERRKALMRDMCTLVAPQRLENTEWGILQSGGLTKREYFAGLAMQGLCSGMVDIAGWGVDPATVAGVATQVADALIAELNNPSDE